MNKVDKEKLQKIISLIIEGIGSKTQDIAKIKDATRKTLNDLAKNDTYTKEYNEKKAEETKNNFLVEMQTRRAGLVKSLEELRQLIQERDETLDLANPALINALGLIQTMGGNLTYEQTAQINANFTHDQASLKVLNAAYKASGVVSTGGIDSMLYNANDTIDKLLDLVEAGTSQDATINHFASNFAKFAELEGMQTDPSPDLAGIDEVMRAAAGL